MDDRMKALKEKLERLVRETADVSVELDRASGTLEEVPHYSVIESRAHELGQQLSREIQQRQMSETIALRIPKAKCPTCGTRCELIPTKRTVKSIDGPVEIQELKGRCPFCRRAFFPSPGETGV
jgi:uncharacterized protein with PIN domain